MVKKKITKPNVGKKTEKSTEERRSRKKKTAPDKREGREMPTAFTQYTGKSLHRQWKKQGGPPYGSKRNVPKAESGSKRKKKK